MPGYRQEKDVDAASETETFVAARLMIDDWRWSGVPFYVRTGKRLPKRATEIAIQYREVPHRLFKDEGVEPDANLLAIRIQPDEGIMLRFGAKVPGLGLDVRSVTMDFTYGSAFSVDSPDAYETLILDALQGDASLFTRADEVEEAWSIVDPIVDGWADAPAPDVPQLRGRDRGARPPPTSCWPATAAAGGGSERRPMISDAPVQLGEPALRWSARAHSIAEIESELARIWASQDLTDAMDGAPGRHVVGSDERDEPGRRRSPAGAGRALRRHDPGADRPTPVANDRHPVGRPRRPVLAGRPGGGALRAAARGRSGDLRRDDPRDLRWRIRASPGRRSRRR